MATIHRFTGSQVLCPDDLRIAADAFEAALGSLPDEACALQPYTARQLLARHIIESALAGQRDPVQLREGALAFIGSELAKQAA